MVHARHRGFALGGKASNHQRSTGTNVWGPHGGAAEMRHATHDGVVAVGTNVGTQAL